jgi:hypothetical protein
VRETALTIKEEGTMFSPTGKRTVLGVAVGVASVALWCADGQIYAAVGSAEPVKLSLEDPFQQTAWLQKLIGYTQDSPYVLNGDPREVHLAGGGGPAFYWPAVPKELQPDSSAESANISQPNATIPKGIVREPAQEKRDIQEPLPTSTDTTDTKK